MAAALQIMVHHLAITGRHSLFFRHHHSAIGCAEGCDANHRILNVYLLT